MNAVSAIAQASPVDATRANFAAAIADAERAKTAWHEARNDFDGNAALDREASARGCAAVFFKQLTGLDWERVERAMS